MKSLYDLENTGEKEHKKQRKERKNARESDESRFTRNRCLATRQRNWKETKRFHKEKAMAENKSGVPLQK